MRPPSSTVLPEGFVAAGGYNGTIHMWGAPGRAYTCRAHRAKVTCIGPLAFAMWASGTSAGMVAVRSGDGVHSSVMCGSPVATLCGLTGGRLAIGCRNGVVEVYEPPVHGSSRRPDRHCWYEHPCAICSAAALACGALVTADASGGMLRLSPDKLLLEPLTGHTDQVGCLLALRGGSLASGSRDSSVRVWRGSRCAETLMGHQSEVVCLAELTSGVLASGAMDSTVRLWRGGSCLRVLCGHRGPVRAVAALPGGVVASAGPCNAPRLWW